MSHKWKANVLRTALLLGAALQSLAALAITIDVPGDQPTIQGAIAVAQNGDEVVVAAGTYAEELNFLGKAITVRSAAGAAQTIIDPSAIRSPRERVFRNYQRRVIPGGRVEVVEGVFGQVVVDTSGRSFANRLAGSNDGSVVLFTNNETRAAVLEGFTITGGDANFDGGGVRIEQGASPTLRHNVITGNKACTGGAGISISFSSPLIENNVISSNQQFGCSGGDGGGIAITGAASAEVRGNTISGNSFSYGGGISLFAAGTPTIANNYIFGNTSNLGGGGFEIANVSNALIVQNVVRNNTGGNGDGDGVSWLVPSGARGPFLINNSIVRNDDRDIFADGFDIASQIVGNVIVANAGGTAVFCGNFNDPNPPVIASNNVLAPGGSANGGICGNPTGSNGNISADPSLSTLPPAICVCWLVHHRSMPATRLIRTYRLSISTGPRASSTAMGI